MIEAIILVVALGAIVFFAWRIGKVSQREKQQSKTLNRVKEANEVEHDINRLSPDERRERLRNDK